MSFPSDVGTFKNQLKHVLAVMAAQESNCEPLDPKVDPDGTGQLSSGYFQLKLDYYIDGMNLPADKKHHYENQWIACSKDMASSIKCIHGYARRYESFIKGISNIEEKLARLHNGGMSGWADQKAIDYWHAIQNQMKQKNAGYKKALAMIEEC